MVQDGLRVARCVDSDFDGCMYGTMSCTGEPMKKMWRFATNIPLVHALFRVKCDKSHSHSHAEGRGPDLRNTQYYTPAMALLLHTCFSYLSRSIACSTAMMGSIITRVGYPE